MFLRSDTNMLVLSALPIFPEGSPQGHESWTSRARSSAGLCQDERILLHAQALPNVGKLDAALDAMEHTANAYPVAAWKTFTHFPDAFEGDGNGWWLDDRDPSGGRWGSGSSARPRTSAPTDLHPQGTVARARRSPRPTTSGPAAKRHPDMNFVAYHSGFEAGTCPRGRTRRRPRHIGTNRLIWSMEREGIGPNENVYAEIGHVMVVRDALPRPGRALPRQAAEATSARTTCCGAPTACSTGRRSR